MVTSKKPRIFSGVPPPSKGGTGKYTKNDFCRKSNNTMGQTDLLEDLVGFVNQDGNANNMLSERNGDDDDEIEIGSDYPYADEL